jgi:hypothetical protein
MALTVTANTDFDTSAPVVARQRSTSATNTDIFMSGGSTGTTATHIEGQLNGGAFVQLTGETISSSAWSGTLGSVPKGEYSLVLRKTNATGDSVTAILLVGDVGLGVGDSVSVGANLSGTLSSGINHSWCWHPSNSTWFRFDIHSDAGCYPLLLTQLAADQACPQMFIYGGASGSHLSAWVSGTFPDSAISTTAASLVNALRYHLWFVATNDVITGGGSPGQQRATIAGYCATAKAYLASGLSTAGVTPASVNVFYMIGECPSSQFDLRHDIDQVRLGIVDAVAAGTGSLGGVMFDLDYPDDTHPSGSTQAQQFADRNWMALKDAAYTGSLGRGPRVTTVTKNAGLTTFIVTFDQNITTATGSSTVSGFRVLNGDGSAATITSQTVTSARSVTLTVSPAATGTPTVSWASGNDAVAANIVMSALISLPDTTTAARPAEPFIEHAVVAATAQGHYGSVSQGIVRGPRK